MSVCDNCTKIKMFIIANAYNGGGSGGGAAGFAIYLGRQEFIFFDCYFFSCA